MILIKQQGDFSKTIKFLTKMKNQDAKRLLNKYGKRGVELLSRSTPVDTGLTASSWRYEIVTNKDSYTIEFLNDNIQNGTNIAIILQYGHGTRNGGYVQGIDYINPAIRPIFEKIAESAFKEVSNS